MTLWHARSPVNLLHIFKTTFLKNTSGGLLLVKRHLITTIFRLSSPTMRDIGYLKTIPTQTSRNGESKTRLSVALVWY